MINSVMGTPTTDDQEKVARLRELLPATGAGIYLDTAYRGPLPAETAAAMRDAEDWELRVGRATEGRGDDAAQRRSEARAVLAALVGGDPADICLTTGDEQGLAIAAWAPDWQPTDRVLTLTTASDGILAALAGVRDRFRVELDLVDTADALSPTTDTKLVILPHVDQASGRMLPIENVARSLTATGAWLVVDATMSAGAALIDVESFDADFVAFAADRWLLGPEDTGALWVGPRPRASGRAAFPGSGGFETLHRDVARQWPDARRFEPGGLPRTAVLGLARSVGWLEMYVGLDWAIERGTRLATRLHAALSVADGVEVITPLDAIATTVCFRLTAWPTDEALDELRRRVFAIIGSTGDGEAVRASVAWFNTDEELDRFASAVSELGRHTPDSLPRRPPLIVR
jgi:selenocysteine lyase/cysteine desulfurase